MIETYIPVNNIKKIIFTPKEVIQYTFRPEVKTRRLIKKWFKPNYYVYEIKHAEYFLPYRYDYYRGQHFNNTLNISDFEALRKDENLDNKYKLDGDELYLLPFIKVILKDKGEIYRFFYNDEAAKAFIDNLLEKADNKFEVI